MSPALHRLLGEARTLVGQGQFYAAMERLRPLLAVAERHGEIDYLYAFCLQTTGQDASVVFQGYDEALQRGMIPFWVYRHKGLLFSELGDYPQALEQLRLARAENPEDACVGMWIASIERFLRTASPAELASPYRPPLSSPHHHLTWLEEQSNPQSLQFMLDLLPAIQRVLGDWPAVRDWEVLDLGAASGAGSDFLARLYRGHWANRPRLRVSAMDIVRTYQRYAAAQYPAIHYRVGDLFQLDESERWDLVLCSHTIEHLTDPETFIRAVQRRARRAAIFYAPFQERSLIAGHLQSIDEDFVAQFDPLWMEVGSSPAWQHPVDAESRTVIFVLPGLEDKARSSGKSTAVAAVA